MIYSRPTKIAENYVEINKLLIWQVKDEILLQKIYQQIKTNSYVTADLQPLVQVTLSFYGGAFVSHALNILTDIRSRCQEHLCFGLVDNRFGKSKIVQK